MNIIKFETLDSTNKYALDNLESLNDLDVIYTKNQTKGKGRMTRTWISTASSLTFSLVIKNKDAISKFSSLSLLSASSVYLTLSKYIKKGLSIKWPNDVYYKDNKITGILLESYSLNDEIKGLVIGIGINVNNTKEELKNTNNKSTSIYQVTHKVFDIEQILNEVLDNFNNLYLKLLNGNEEYLSIVKHNNYLMNKTVYAYINDVKTRVRVIDIKEDNKLIVKHKKETLELESDEVTLHKKIYA